VSKRVKDRAYSAHGDSEPNARRFKVQEHKDPTLGIADLVTELQRPMKRTTRDDRPLRGLRTTSKLRDERVCKRRDLVGIGQRMRRQSAKVRQDAAACAPLRRFRQRGHMSHYLVTRDFARPCRDGYAPRLINPIGNSHELERLDGSDSRLETGAPERQLSRASRNRSV